MTCFHLDQFYAHTTKDSSPWEPLFTRFSTTDPDDPKSACSGNNGAPCLHCINLEPQHGHLNKVAYLSANFAANMFPEGPDRESARQWGYLTGLWHDLGKYSPEWQEYLKSKADIHQPEASGAPLKKEDHTTAGAKHAVSISALGHMIATAIAGHHAGLLDARHESHACLEKRLQKSFGNEIPNIVAPDEITNNSLPPLSSFLTNLPRGKDSNFALAFFQRMIFSCLVDADFLATESFMSPKLSSSRASHQSDIFSQALKLLQNKITSFGSPPPDDKVANARANVVADCTAAADSPSGIFTLTVPTGGGKTLSSLNFALRHAIKHQKKRIIYVIPFTSIIEQNASVFRDLLATLGEEVIIEHHSNLSPDAEQNQTITSRLAAENWDAPIIVTTAVQFYESLYAAKTTKSRKLHNIANSVVILDEAQCLPTQYLEPCLRVLRELSENYHTTTVLCTATQPAVAKSSDFPIGFPGSNEIIKDPQKLYADLNRVNVTYRGQLSDETISSEIAQATQALCIVNTRKHAHRLFKLLPGNTKENFHLSTLMCPQHRLQVLANARKRLNEKLPVRLISTQLIEAGVDVDFPIVYRSMAGLDSIAQAAGRCNREGKIVIGQAHVFHSEHIKSERYFADTACVGHEFLDLHTDDPLGTEAVQGYFNKYYHQNRNHWDAKHILDDFEFGGSPDLPFIFNYRTAAEKFNLIENKQIPIIIPWDDVSKDLIKNKLCNETISLHRDLLRGLQRYTVQIYDNDYYKNQHQFQSVRDGEFHILICPETHYSDQFGLNLTDEAPNSNTLICSS
ncbi:MAG: CRISPR-associated helicase Cas3' [Verrucomicrobiae bacterium]|nr:CRISPR-associated helicase Cas3' [Verrucomicrobiae bacterium]NNJ41779.1 CRISPR-associated helicase Cas3' [Akkermansiaceae bacterium]